MGDILTLPLMSYVTLSKSSNLAFSFHRVTSFISHGAAKNKRHQDIQNTQHCTLKQQGPNNLPPSIWTRALRDQEALYHNGRALSLEQGAWVLPGITTH